MIFFSALLTFIAVYIIQAVIYRKKSYKNLTYSVRCDTDEAFCGEDIRIFEEIENDKLLPLPYVKVNTDTPEGICFHFTERKGGELTDSYDTGIQSVFVMKSYQKISRRWRVNCLRRGVYSFTKSVIITNNLFGLEANSKNLQAEPSPSNTVTVLPRPMALDEHFTSSRYNSGDIVTNHSLMTDPLSRAGVREYSPDDPMNRINWNATARTGKLTVNLEDYVTRFMFNIVLNMNSYIIERQGERLISEEDVERGITVAASILDRVSRLNMPVRLIMNTPPETLSENPDSSPLCEDGTGRQITVSRAYSGIGDTLNALRLLAQVKLRLSVPVEQLMQHMEEFPSLYQSGGNVVFITAFLDERMIRFCWDMKLSGVNVIVYVTSTNRNVPQIPEDIEAYIAR